MRLLRTQPLRSRPIAALLILLAAGPAAGQAPAGAVLRDFEPVGLILELDGKTVDGAELYQSRSAGAILVLSSEFQAPVLFQLRTGQVESVDLMKMDRQDDGSIDLLPEPILAALGAFEVTSDGAGIRFGVEGRRGMVRQKPPLLGFQGPEDLLGYSPEYRQRSEAYTPSGPILDKLRDKTLPVRVEVFFGTWCGFCQEMVPRMIRVAEELEGSGVSVSYYGLPQDFSDPKTKQYGIDGVPTAIVYGDDGEVGRITGNSWKVPELALNSVISSAERKAAGR